SSRRRHTRFSRDWSSDVCSSDLLLSDFQVSIPEIGTIKARQVPFVVITSNRTREVHDALKRRCLYHWIDYPDLDKEVEIVRAREIGRASCRERGGAGVGGVCVKG